METVWMLKGVNIGGFARYLGAGGNWWDEINPNGYFDTQSELFDVLKNEADEREEITDMTLVRVPVEPSTEEPQCDTGGCSNPRHTPAEPSMEEETS